MARIPRIKKDRIRYVANRGYKIVGFPGYYSTRKVAQNRLSRFVRQTKGLQGLKRQIARSRFIFHEVGGAGGLVSDLLFGGKKSVDRDINRATNKLKRLIETQRKKTRKARQQTKLTKFGIKPPISRGLRKTLRSR